LQQRLEEGRLEWDGLQAIQVEPPKRDAGISVGGPVGPGVVEYGRIVG
jgi:hypothetical protein